MLPLGSGKRIGVGVTAALGVAGTGVRVGVTRGNVGVGVGGSGVSVGGSVGEGGTRVAVGGGGGSVIVGVGTRVGVGGALHPSTSNTSASSASPVKSFPLTNLLLSVTRLTAETSQARVNCNALRISAVDEWGSKPTPLPASISTIAQNWLLDKFRCLVFVQIFPVFLRPVGKLVFFEWSCSWLAH